MPILEFPPVSTADEETGLLAIGGDLHPNSLILAYKSGIFPWPHGDEKKEPLLWFAPPERAILFFTDLHVPKSLEKARKKLPFKVTVDRAFKEVMTECGKTPRPGQDGTWITKPMLKAYVNLHELGLAHSVEVWNGEKLVGGIYGVDVAGAFSAESMFYHEDYASKIALLGLIDHLRNHGSEWIDIQVMTPHMEKLGAKVIAREQFQRLLSETHARRLSLFPSQVEPGSL